MQHKVAAVAGTRTWASRLCFRFWAQGGARNRWCTTGLLTVSRLANLRQFFYLNNRYITTSEFREIAIQLIKIHNFDNLSVFEKPSSNCKRIDRFLLP